MVFPWFETFWQDLLTYKQKNRIPSGLMLCGLPGIGKTAFVKRYAQYILCFNNIDKPCEHCRSCVLFNAGNHPDLFILQPEEAGGIIKIDQVRELVNDLSQTPALGGYQVVIIDKGEDLNRSAANALLKNLEEPHGQVLLLLISERSQSVPPTIRSRCQVLRFPVPSRAQAKDYLSSQISSDENPYGILAMADYLPLKALQYRELVPLRENLITVLEQLLRGQIDPTKAAANYLAQPKETIEIFITIIMDMIKLRYCSKVYLNHHDKMAELASLSHSRTILQLHAFLDILIAAIRALKTRSNANLQSLMETIFIHWRYHDVS